MANRIRISLRTKISVVTTLTVVVVALMLGGLNTYDQLNHIAKFEERFLHDSVRSAATISYTIMPLLVSDNFVSMNSLVTYYAERSDRLYVLVVDSHNRIMADSEEGKMGGTYQPLPAYRTDKAGEGIIRRFMRSGREAIEVSYPVKAGDLVVGNVVMGLNMGWMQEETGIMRKTMIVSTGIALALISLGIMLASALAKRVSQPLRLLTQAAEKVGRGDYSQRIHVEGSDEVGVLADTFDAMVGELRTARTQLVEKEYLLESEERYRSVVENVSIGIAVISPDMEILSLNRAMKSWFPGIVVEERPLCYRSFYQPPMDAVCSYCPTFLTLKDGQVHEAITQTVLEGKTVNHRVLSSPIRDQDGNVVAAIEMVENITERKRAEEALRASEARLKDAQHIAHIGDWEWDIATDRIQWSEELYRIYGCEPHEITPDFGFLVEAMHPKSRDAFVGAIDAALKAGRPFEMDYTFFRRDGSEAILHTVGEVHHDDSGAPVRMAGIVQDITDRRNLQARLEEKTAEQNTILENTLAGIAFLKDRKFVWSNPKTEQMFGYSKDEMNGLTTEAFYPSRESYEQLGEEAYPLLAAGESYTTERLMQRKDGSLFWCSLSGKAVDPSASGKGSIWILQDITERKRAEERIRASLLEKEILLKEVHHRVKNNLQVVASMLRLQSKYLEDRKAKAMFEDSQRRVESMSLIHEKLYRAKDLARIDFREYIGDLVGNVTALNGASGRIEIGMEVGDVRLDVTKGIPCGLIINELVSNALRHAFPDGREGKVVVRMRGDGKGRISLAVSDNGAGFPEHIDFRNTKSLGMQLVVSLVSQLEGTIELDKREGTAFHITFQT